MRSTTAPDGGEASGRVLSTKTGFSPYGHVSKAVPDIPQCTEQRHHRRGEDQAGQGCAHRARGVDAEAERRVDRGVEVALEFSEPLNPVPMGVRRADTRTASGMGGLQFGQQRAAQ